MRMTFKVIIVGGLVGFFAVVTWVVFLPTALWHPERTIIAQGYTGDVGRGRTLFYSNGCNYCHTQYVREQDVAMGPQAQGGNYAEDNPMILGSERTGPDLSYIGRKRSEEWELKHLQHPRDLSPLSIMPNFAGLSVQDQHGIGTYGGTMVVTPVNFRQEPFRAMPDDEWIWHVKEGVPGTLMPVWKTSLSDAQLWRVIDYAQQLFAHPFYHAPDEGDPPPPYAGKTNPLTNSYAVLDSGKAIYTRECQVCHGSSGRGEGPYRTGLEPLPPDLGDGSYGKYTDADYFWRLEVGVPWTAMPVWGLQYSSDELWSVVHNLRTMFTQTEPTLPKPVKGQRFNYSALYQEQTMPATASFERGKALYANMCSHCLLYTSPSPRD